MEDSRAEALARMRRTVALWNVDLGTASDVVFAACDLLVAGVDGPALREFAAHGVGKTDSNIDEPLAEALTELGLPFHPTFSDRANLAALVALCEELLAGRINPTKLTSWVHWEFGHDELEATEELARLDDSYDLLDYTGGTVEEVDALVIAEARRIVASPPS